jgi:SAM-dependent MidA family methyltransferase
MEKSPDHNVTSLEAELVGRIKRDGPITFRDFMEAALYHPALGYYAAPGDRIGARGDYYTSSCIPAFGSVLARAFAGLWQKRGPLTLVELGAGTGRLAADIIDALRTDHSSVCRGLRYVIVDRSPAMRALQAATLSDFAEVEWREMARLGYPGRTEGIVFSNELIDALPVHRVRRHTGHLQEQYVAVAAGPADETRTGRLALMWEDCRTDRLRDFVERSGLTLEDNQIIEINIEALDLLASVTGALQRGFVITIDYGDTSANLFRPDRGAGTLRCFFEHRLNDSPLERIGEQDITASVDFTALIEAGRGLGLHTVSFESQTSFLRRNGLAEVVAARASPETPLASRMMLKHLYLPGGIGDSIKVLVQEKA